MQVFHQTLVHEREARVTYLAEAGVESPVMVDGRVVLESRSSAVWFTFPGAWHDVGRFHTADGRFTGYYANILTPVEGIDGEPPPGWGRDARRDPGSSAGPGTDTGSTDTESAGGGTDAGHGGDASVDAGHGTDGPGNAGRANDEPDDPAHGTDEWRTTDLFLDVFLTTDGRVHVLDRPELEEAVRRGWIEPNTARSAEAEVARLVRAAASGTWPPAVVDAWTLDRARRAAGLPAR